MSGGGADDISNSVVYVHLCEPGTEYLLWYLIGLSHLQLYIGCAHLLLHFTKDACEKLIHAFISSRHDNGNSIRF